MFLMRFVFNENDKDWITGVASLTFAYVNLTFSAINEVRVKGDSCGGEVTCVVRNCPKGLGAPVFDKLEAELAKAMMSLPASKVGIY